MDRSLSTEIEQKIWNVFLAGLNQIEPDPSFVQEILEKISIPGMSDFQLPDVKSENSRILFGEIEMNLESSPLIRKVFEAFLSKPTRKLNRDELVRKVYGIENLHEMSFRRRGSCQHSIVKLISRSRKAAELHFNRDELNLYEWFVYDGNSETWKLLRKKEF